MKKLRILLLMITSVFTSQVFSAVAITSTPVDGDGNVFTTVDFTANEAIDYATVELSFLPTFDRTTFIQNANFYSYDFSAKKGFGCNIQEFISRTNTHLGINKKASALLTARTRNYSKFSDKKIVTLNNSKCVEIENGEEGASPSVVPFSVFTGIKASHSPEPYPSQLIASYTHETHFNSEPGTSKGSLVLSANGLSRVLTLTFKTGEEFSCAVQVGSPIDDFVLAAKPHVVLKGGYYIVRKDTTGYNAGNCVHFRIRQNSRILQ
jgi:hypothetical protein